MALAQPQSEQAFAPGQDAAALLATLDSLRVAITIFDARGCLLHATRHLNFLFPALPPVEHLLGEPYAELVRREIESGAIAPAARQGGDAAFIAARVAQLAPGAYAPRDVPLSDGRVLEIKARRDAAGCAVLLWSDVTAARHQTQRLEEAIGLSADAFAFYDKSDRLLTANALYARLVGAPLEQLKGKPFKLLIETLARSGRIQLDLPVEAWVERRLKNRRGPASAYTLRTAAGPVYLVRDRATPDGGRAAVFSDITEKSRAETALARTESALANSREAVARQDSYLADLSQRLDRASAQADSAKTTLLKSMSHELKTPLNAILGFSDLMGTRADSLSPAQVREYAGLVHQGGTTLLRLVNQIMDLTKLAAGRYDLRRGPVDAGVLLWQARQDFLARAAAKAIALEMTPLSSETLIDADESVLAAMLANLLDNAICFTQPGGTVRLGVTCADKWTALSVSDNGPGVAARDLERILQPFEQAGSVNEHAQGSGLGLTLVKAFAELHGGALGVTSQPGEGFAATITLPAV